MMHPAILTALPSSLLIISLLVSLLLCWTARPIKNTMWGGEQAADMAGGLILALATAGNLWQQLSGHDSALLMLNSLAWYAALPLLVSVRMVQAAQHLGFAWYWDRMIWGRILLALCVVFELSRRANQLDMIIYITALVGAVALFIMAFTPKTTPKVHAIRLLLAGFWAAITLATFLGQHNDIYLLVLPVTILLVTNVFNKRPLNSISHNT